MRSDYVHTLIYRRVLGVSAIAVQGDLSALETALLVPALEDRQVYRILDLGAGSGIWCLDIARYESFMVADQPPQTFAEHHAGDIRTHK